MTAKIFRWSFCGQSPRISAEKVYTTNREIPAATTQKHVTEFSKTRGTHQNYQNG